MMHHHNHHDHHHDHHSPIKVVTARAAVLPGRDEPCPATIEISLETGRIVEVHETQRTRGEYEGRVTEDANFLVLDDDQILLPGLVDAVGGNHNALFCSLGSSKD